MTISPTAARAQESYLEIGEGPQLRREMQEILVAFREMHRHVTEYMEENDALHYRIAALEATVAEMREESGRVTTVTQRCLGLVDAIQTQLPIPVDTFLRATLGEHHVDGRLGADRMWQFSWHTGEREDGSCVVDPSDLALEIRIEGQEDSTIGIFHAGERRETFELESSEYATLVQEFISATVRLRTLEEVLRIPATERVA